MGIERPMAAAMSIVGLLASANGLAADEASAGASSAETYQDAWGPSVGDTVPTLVAEDQDGNVRDLASLTGEGGLVLVVSRSAVW